MTEQATLGEALRDEGMYRAAVAESATWKERADAAIRKLAASGQDFTAEDVRKIVGDPSHPNAMGARLNAASRRGEIRLLGYVKARRPSLHACRIGIWRGATGAVEW